LTAFGTRYADEERIAGVQFPENIWHEDCRQSQDYTVAKRDEAVARRAIHAAQALPHTIVLTGGNLPSMDPWDLVGNQVGGFMPDPRFFTQDCGTGGVWPEVTCSTWNYRWMQEHYGAVPMATASEPNGWVIAGGGFTEPNPFGYAAGSKPSLDGESGARIFTWYTSTAPRGPKKDSQVGQPGDDPAGILPSNWLFFSDDQWWSDRPLPTLAEWDAAFKSFCFGGGEGTNACPSLPPGFEPI
jgi:hypothetical protein